MAGPAAAQGDAAAREGLARTLATRLFGPETGAELGPVTPAARWRLLDGPRLRGDLRMSADAAAQTRRYGFFAFELRGQGVFEGIFNVKPGGRRVVGVFWPDGRLNQGQAAGFLDLEADAQGVGRGGVTFIAGESLDGVTAR